MSQQLYDQTAQSLSIKADCVAQFVRKLTLKGKLDHIVLPNGMRLYKASAAATVRKMKAESLAKRGRYARARKLN